MTGGWFRPLGLSLPETAPSCCEKLPAPMKKKLLKAAIEISFIIFLFYSNLLMGEFTTVGRGNKRGLFWAIEDIFTTANFFIAVGLATVGFALFELLRKLYK